MSLPLMSLLSRHVSRLRPTCRPALRQRHYQWPPHYVSESSVYRLLKAHDLIASPAFIVIKAADEFKDKTTAPNRIWQTDFTYLVGVFFDLKLFDEINLRAVLALANVPAQLQGLLECEKARRAISCGSRHPQQNHIASGVGAIGDRVAWRICAGCCRPRFDPRRASSSATMRVETSAYKSRFMSARWL
jgi:hypothetical protein